MKNNKGGMATMQWYKFNINDMTDKLYARYYSLMNAEKQHRVDRFRFADDKKRTVAGEMLARNAISAECGIPPGEIILATGEHGKPCAENIDIHFNISHSGDYAVCAVNDKPVGIDIEEIRPVNLKIARKICNADELAYIFGHEPTADDFTDTTDKDKLTRFFEIWTKKEACGKCAGTGLLFDTPENDYHSDIFRDISGYIVTVCTKQ